MSDQQSWQRVHANDMLAVIFKSPWSDERFIAGAIPRHGGGSLADVPGPLAAAQAHADQKSGCAQPCTCSGWH